MYLARCNEMTKQMLIGAGVVELLHLYGGGLYDVIDDAVNKVLTSKKRKNKKNKKVLMVVNEIHYLKVLSYVKRKCNQWLTHGRAMRNIVLTINGTTTSINQHNPLHPRESRKHSEHHLTA